MRRGCPVHGVTAVPSTAYTAVPPISVGRRARPTHRTAYAQLLLLHELLREDSNIIAGKYRINNIAELCHIVLAF